MELVDLYDENRIPLGKTAERHAPKGLSLIHISEPTRPY